MVSLQQERYFALWEVVNTEEKDECTSETEEDHVSESDHETDMEQEDETNINVNE